MQLRQQPNTDQERQRPDSFYKIQLVDAVFADARVGNLAGLVTSYPNPSPIAGHAARNRAHVFVGLLSLTNHNRVLWHVFDYVDRAGCRDDNYVCLPNRYVFADEDHANAPNHEIRRVLSDCDRYCPCTETVC